MKVVLHLGAHCTDGDRLLKCLLRNSDKLAEQGIIVPEPARYRPVIRDMMHVVKKNDASLEVRQAVLDSILDDDGAARVILGHDSFLGVPGRSVEDNRLYTAVSARLPRLRQLFGGFEMELFLAIRDPATFIPAAFERAQEVRFDKFVEGSDPLSLRWSEMISRLRAAAPDVPVTIWCNEDSPLIWSELLQRLSAHDSFTELDGRNDFQAELMTRNGRAKMAAYLKKHPPKNEKQRMRVVEAFLEKFARADAIEEEVDVPGWTEDYVAQLSANYEADLDIIRGIDGVTLVEP